MQRITVTGTLEIQDNNGQPFTIQAADFDNIDSFDGTTSISYDSGNWSVEITVEIKDNMFSEADWQTKNCEIISNGISFS